MSKLDEKLPSYAKINVLVPRWHLAYFVPIDGLFGQIVRYGLQISAIAALKGQWPFLRLLAV